ncbi:hypothetical protein Sjap_019992 [Stephania japonica]|uniref:RING-type E3 ubiquitin transferase n=1 Tax=Stephania japonica TaxID=461633 RepID=A0AAP0F562_9MAGN
MLKCGDGSARSVVESPELVLRWLDEETKLERRQKEEKIEDHEIEIGLGIGRYNPIWADGEEKSIDFYSKSPSFNCKSWSPPLYPQRVPLNLLNNQASTAKRSQASSVSNSDTESESSSKVVTNDDGDSTDSETEIKEKNTEAALFDKQNLNIPSESTCSPGPQMADSDNLPGGKHTPPKDFVCPITSHIFVDPVTLETGQTYERRAIQEWLDRGSSTCPITRQELQSTQLPKTNYVLKRLIASWQEKNPGSTQIQSDLYQLQITPSLFDSTRTSSSPRSVISQANSDGTITELRLAINNVCMSEILAEAETAVIQIERFWREANMESDNIEALLSKPAVINGFVEVLLNSIDPKVLRATIFLLCELGSKDKNVIQTLTRVDSDVDCVVALFKRGLLEAVVLIYLLKPSTSILFKMDLVESLLMIIKNKEGDSVDMCVRPKTAALLLLQQVLGGGEEKSVSKVARSVASANTVESVIGSLEVEGSEERIAAVGILLRCMQEDGKCRNTIADKANLTPLLESLIGATDGEKFQIVHFLFELVKLNRRTLNEQNLHMIKEQGTFSIMHALLVYLQTALPDQCPLIAGLLIQLDLLLHDGNEIDQQHGVQAEPRKMSIYREEAIDAIISSLRNSDFPEAQLTAAETILALQGRFSSSGKPLARAFLLKRAGLDRRYNSIMQNEQLGRAVGKSREKLAEEKASDEWERKIAFALASHEFGLLFEALAEGMKSEEKKLSSVCFVSATWLTNMLTVLPDTGIRGAAQVCLLKQFISIFKSARDVEDKALAMLALSSFLQDPEGLSDLTPHMKDMLKSLRELKKSSSLAAEILKTFSDGQDTSFDMWNYKELIQVDCGGNVEVLSIICFKDKIFSGLSDGMLKVWAIGNELIQCVQVHDVKDQVLDMAVANNILCFVPHGAGIKVHSWNGDAKLFNPNKSVKCMALVQGKLYCGCNDSSMQEIDLATDTISTIQNGTRKLIGKANPIHALRVSDGMIYSASTSTDGTAVKIWSASNFTPAGSLPSTLEVRSMLISSDLIYLGGKMGSVEVWCKRKRNRVETLQTRTNGKVLCMAVDKDEEVLVAGTSDGRIQYSVEENVQEFEKHIEVQQVFDNIRLRRGAKQGLFAHNMEEELTFNDVFMHICKITIRRHSLMRDLRACIYTMSVLACLRRLCGPELSSTSENIMASIKIKPLRFFPTRENFGGNRYLLSRATTGSATFELRFMKGIDQQRVIRRVISAFGSVLGAFCISGHLAATHWWRKLD